MGILFFSGFYSCFHHLWLENLPFRCWHSSNLFTQSIKPQGVLHWSPQHFMFSFVLACSLSPCSHTVPKKIQRSYWTEGGKRSGNQKEEISSYACLFACCFHTTPWFFNQEWVKPVSDQHCFPLCHGISSQWADLRSHRTCSHFYKSTTGTQ